MASTVLSTILSNIQDSTNVVLNTPLTFGINILLPPALNVRCVIAVSSSVPLFIQYQKVLHPELSIGNIDTSVNQIITYVNYEQLYSLLLQYLSTGISFCDTLLLDGSHAGDVYYTLCVGLWSKAKSNSLSVPKLVQDNMSSGIDLGIPRFTPKIIYSDKNYERASFYDDITRLVLHIHNDTGIESGDILIFIHASKELDTLISRLKLNLLRGAKIISETDPKYESVLGIRNIIVVRYAPEPIVMQGRIGYVIDTMYENIMETSLAGGIRYARHYISHDIAKTRAECAKNICYRLCTQTKYDELDLTRVPDLNRIPLYKFIIDTLDLDPNGIIDDPRLPESLALVKQLGLNDIAMRKFVNEIPLDFKNAVFLWKWIQAGYPIFHGICVANLIANYGPYFNIPRPDTKLKLQEYTAYVDELKSKYFNKFIGYNDLETCLNLWTDFMETSYAEISRINTSNPASMWVAFIEGQNIRGTDKILPKWIAETHLNDRKIYELFTGIRHCIKILRKKNYEVQVGSLNTPEVIEVARPILASIYPIMNQKKGIIYTDINSGQDYRLNIRENFNNFTLQPPPALIAILTQNITTAKGTLQIIIFALDTNVAELPSLTEENAFLIDQMFNMFNSDILTLMPSTLSTLSTLPLGGPNDMSVVDIITLQLPRSSVLVSYDQDYTRYLYIQAMRQINPNINDWLLNLASVSDTGSDPIFSPNKLSVTNPINLAFANQLAQLGVADAGTIVGTCIAYGNAFIQLQSYPPAPQALIQGDRIAIGDYITSISTMKQLQNKGSTSQIAKMVLRYACVPDTKQLLVPNSITSLLSDKYGIDFSAYESGTQSRFPRYNSLFPDTDAVFGGMEKFGTTFMSGKVFVNPPQHMIQHMIEYVINNINQVQQVMFVILITKITDAEWYRKLETNTYLVSKFDLRVNDYYYVNAQNTVYDTRYDVSMFVLNRGFDIDVKKFEYDIRTIYKMGLSAYNSE